MWFTIRKNKSLKEKAKHLFETIELSRYLPETYRNVIDAAITKNGFFALLKNIMLSIIADEKEDVRSDILNKILLARQNNKHLEFGLPSKIPTINFNASTYFEMIDESKTAYISLNYL